MTKVTVLSNPAATDSQTAARVSLAATAIFVPLLAVLHVIKPELDPSWHFISEYAIGTYGWLMMLAFSAWRLAVLACSSRSSHKFRRLPARLDLSSF